MCSKHRLQERNALTLIDLFKDAYIWIGLNDKDNDGIYRYFSTGSLTYILDLWDKDQPTGDRYVST